MVDIKIFVGTNKIKIVSRKAADKINFWCNRAFVKGNTYYNLPEDLCIKICVFLLVCIKILSFILLQVNQT